MLLVVVATGALSLAAATLWSKVYWNYWLAPPELPAILAEVSKVTSASQYFGFDHQTTIPLTPDGYRSLADQDRRAPFFSETPELRIPFALYHKGLLSQTIPELEENQVKAIVQKLMPLHKESHNGRLYEVEASGQMYVLFFGTTFPLDHRTYRETVALKRPDGTLNILSSQSFNFDSAGIEGVTWQLIFGALWSCFAVLGTLGLTIVVGFQALKRRKERTQQTNSPYREPSGSRLVI